MKNERIQTNTRYFLCSLRSTFVFFLCKYIFRILFIHSDILKQTEIGMISCINSTALKSHDVCFSVTLVKKGIFNGRRFYTIISSLVYWPSDYLDSSQTHRRMNTDYFSTHRTILYLLKPSINLGDLFAEHPIPAFPKIVLYEWSGTKRNSFD